MTRRIPARLLFFALASLIAAACASNAPPTPQSIAKTEAKAKRLLEEKRWEQARAAAEAGLADCDRAEWCAKDNRYQGLFHTEIGEAEEHLGRPERALDHYRKAFNAYPLFFTENYFRFLRDAGMYKILRQEIDAKLASNEAAYRSASAFWLSPEKSACGGRPISGSYSWTLKAPGAKAPVSGKAALSQSGCVVAADIALPLEGGAGSLLRLRADIHGDSATLVFGPPCIATDKARLATTPTGFTVSAERAPGPEGCFRGAYTIEFVKN